MKTKLIKPEIIFPKWSKILQSNEWSSFKRLGKQNVEEIISNLHHKLKYVKEDNYESTDELDHYISLLEGKTQKDFLKSSKGFFNPKIPKKSLEKDKSWNVFEPTRGQDLALEKGSTTLNNCGWCDYAQSHMSMGGYDVNLESSCKLYTLAGKKFKELKLSESCSFIKLDDFELEELVSIYKAKKKRIEKQNKNLLSKESPALQNVDEVESILRKVGESSDDKPLLHNLRSFNRGDIVLKYIFSDEDAFREYKNTTVEGTVVTWGRLGPIFHCDKKFHSGSLNNGRGYHMRGGVEYIHKSTFEYMKKDNDYVQLWLDIWAPSKEETWKKEVFSKWLMKNTS